MVRGFELFLELSLILSECGLVPLSQVHCIESLRWTLHDRLQLQPGDIGGEGTPHFDHIKHLYCFSQCFVHLEVQGYFFAKVCRKSLLKLHYANH